MKIRAVLISTVLLTPLAAGCTQKESAPAPSASQPSTAAPASSTAPVVGKTTTCAPQGGNQIKINGDGISCDDAYTIAAKYDLQGEKYQEIKAAEKWTCYTGTVESRPLIFQCVSGQETEFGVYPES
jgi:hypothetical protein